jgi:RNA-directed DNA polymerase
VRRTGGLYAGIADLDNLLTAYHRAGRGKLDRSAVAAFGADLHGNLAALRAELLAEDVVLHGYRFFLVHDPKPRRIAAPAFRDRVLHHAILQQLEPALERVAVHDSYACRRGKGLHRAIARAQTYARRHTHYLQLDVRKFFDSIDHGTLLQLLARRCKDRPLLRLLARIVGSYATAPGVGLPIGSLTSQHLANFYLAPLDHFVKETLRIRGYVRYMDDFVLFGDDAELRAARAAVVAFLRDTLRLQPKHAGILRPCTAGLACLGLLVRPSHVRLAGKTKRRMRRRLQALVAGYRAGCVDPAALARRTTAVLVRTHQVRARGLRRRWVAEFAGVDA